jgi:hypothetical protein
VYLKRKHCAERDKAEAHAQEDTITDAHAGKFKNVSVRTFQDRVDNMKPYNRKMRIGADEQTKVGVEYIPQ